MNRSALAVLLVAGGLLARLATPSRGSAFRKRRPAWPDLRRGRGQGPSQAEVWVVRASRCRVKGPPKGLPRGVGGGGNRAEAVAPGCADEVVSASQKAGPASFRCGRWECKPLPGPGPSGGGRLGPGEGLGPGGWAAAGPDEVDLLPSPLGKPWANGAKLARFFPEERIPAWEFERDPGSGGLGPRGRGQGPAKFFVHPPRPLHQDPAAGTGAESPSVGSPAGRLEVWPSPSPGGWGGMP